jgi:hypothetical protein
MMNKGKERKFGGGGYWGVGRRGGGLTGEIVTGTGEGERSDQKAPE